jgi:hypothetical protein
MQRLCHSPRRYETRADGTRRKTSSGEPGWFGDTWGADFGHGLCRGRGDPADSPVSAGELKNRGCDYIDVSGGGLVPYPGIPLGPGYQAPYAARIRPAVGMVTMAVGMISQPRWAEEIMARGRMRAKSCTAWSGWRWARDGISASSTWGGEPGARLGREAPVLAVEPPMIMPPSITLSSLAPF